MMGYAARNVTDQDYLFTGNPREKQCRRHGAFLMPGVILNGLTKKLDYPADERCGVEKMLAMETKTGQEPLAVVKMQESQAGPELKPKRAPVRKYIRKEGLPGQQRLVAEVVEEQPKEISIESLRKKFGLPEAKNGGFMVYNTTAPARKARQGR
jgi:hypothetical protein